MTKDKLLSILHYEPSTGVFTWKSYSGHVTPGKIAGSVSDQGYIRIGIAKKDYRAHRLAWLYMTGDIPEVEVDHINRNRADNRWENLRLATPKQNRENTSIRSDNTSGIRGVALNRSRKKWHAQICHNGKTINLGRFNDFFDAMCARKSAESKYFTHSQGLYV